MRRSKLKLNRETITILEAKLHRARGGDCTCTCTCCPTCDASCGCPDPTYVSCDTCNCPTGRETDCNCI